MKGVDVREEGAGLVVAVRVRPRSRPGIHLTDGGLVVSVAASPEKGRATEEARHALANVLGVPPSAVSLRSGRTSRRKTFTIQGADVTDARTRLLAAGRSDLLRGTSG
jgi:uncharacterized protein